MGMRTADDKITPEMAKGARVILARVWHTLISGQRGHPPRSYLQHAEHGNPDVLPVTGREAVRRTDGSTGTGGLKKQMPVRRKAAGKPTPGVAALSV